jgi:hypothetical protein
MSLAVGTGGIPIYMPANAMAGQPYQPLDPILRVTNSEPRSAVHVNAGSQAIEAGGVVRDGGLGVGRDSGTQKKDRDHRGDEDLFHG